jgi:hypothetical protein
MLALHHDKIDSLGFKLPAGPLHQASLFEGHSDIVLQTAHPAGKGTW